MMAMRTTQLEFRVLDACMKLHTHMMCANGPMDDEGAREITQWLVAQCELEQLDEDVIEIALDAIDEYCLVTLGRSAA